MLRHRKTRLITGTMGLLIVLIIMFGFGYRQLQRENEMNPGLNVKRIHARGIDGTGVSVAIIDQKLLTTHREYNDRLRHYAEIGDTENEPYSMHGPAVTSILAGRNCGVAPGVDLDHWAVAVHGPEPAGYRYAQAIRDVVAFNQNLPRIERIRIISISTGFREQDGGDVFAAAIKEAQDAGILVFTSTYPYFTDPALAVYNAALRKGGSRDDSNDYTVQPEVVEYQGRPAAEIISERNQRSMEAGYAPIWVPVEPRVLTSWRGDSKYEFYGAGGDSWATPYIAGIAALIMQVNPKLTNQQVVKIIADTVFENKNGLLMINPEKIVAVAADTKEVVHTGR